MPFIRCGCAQISGLQDALDCPRWAAVDGVPASIFQVDGMFRGVAIDGGKHEVLFSYRPLWLQWGAGVSVVTGLVIGLGLLYMLLASAAQWFGRE